MNQKHRWTRTALAAKILLGATTMLATPAWAQDGTWAANPSACPAVTRCDYNAAANWGPAGVPTGTATFGATTISDIEFVNPVGSPPIVIGRFLFTATAPAYTFLLVSDELTFTGEGIVNNSTATQTLVSGNRSTLRFANSSSAGNASLLAEGSGGIISFEGSSTAATSVITIGASGFGTLNFSGSSTAASATISNPFGNINFFGTSTAGSAAITNIGGMIFRESSSLGAATITNRTGLGMFNDASGADGTIINEAGGIVDISQVAGGAASTSIGSLSGAGNIRLGGRNLTLGALNRTETISGAISDGGERGGTGGSLTKLGTGTLTMSGASTYTGATTVNGGTLLLTGSITGAGATTIGSGSGANGRLTIQSGGTMSSNGAANIGAFGGTGNVLVTGTGSSWTVNGGLALGQPQLAVDTPGSGGIGRLTIENSASVISNGVNITRAAGGADGAATIGGAGSVWTTGALGIQSPTGTTVLTIQSGGRVNSGAVTLAGGVLATGSGTVWNTGHLVIGPNINANGNPLGSIRIAAGAVVNSASAVMAEGGSFTSSVSVDGAGSAWNTGSNLVLAPTPFFSAQVSVLNGGALNVGGGAGTISVGPNGGVSFFTIGGGAPGTTGGRLNAASILVGAGSILSFEYAGSTSVFDPVITGAGRVFVGGGSTILSASSTAFAGTTTIFSGGTLQFGNGGASGALGGDVVNNGALIINRTGALTLGGIISGTGSLTHAGPATATLSAVNTYTGATRIDGGTLVVTGAIAGSAVTVGSGGTLGGIGTVGSTSILSGGTLSPGLSVGTLNIAGDLSFASGGNFIVEVGPAAADRVNVTGTAALTGALTALSLGGTFAADRQYTLLNAAGGITGTFNQLVTQGSFGNLVPRLTYNGNSVILGLAVGGGGGTFTTTTSQTDAILFNAPTITVQRVNLFQTRIIGRLAGGTALFDQTFNDVLNSASVQNGLLAARAAITTAGGPGIIIISDPVLLSRVVTQVTSSSSIFSLAGSSDTITTTTTFGPATITIGDRRSCGAAIGALPAVTRPACGTPGGTVFEVLPGTTNVNTNTRTDYLVNEARTDTTTETTIETYELTGTVAAIGTIYGAVQSSVFDLASRFLGRIGGEGSPSLFGESGGGASTASALAPELGPHSTWAEVYGFRNRNAARGGIAAERRDAFGFAGGFSIGVGANLRLGFGLDHGRLDLEVQGAGERADVELTQLAATARFGFGALGVSIGAVHGVGSVGGSRTLLGATASSYDVSHWGFLAEASYLLQAGSWRIVPRLALDHVRMESDAFTERGAFALAVPAASRSRTRAAAGLEVGRSFATGAGGRIDLAATARYVAVLDGEERTLPVAFTLAPGAPLVMRGLSERDSLVLGGQLGIQVTPMLGLYLAYEGHLASGYDAHAAAAGLRISW